MIGIFATNNKNQHEIAAVSLPSTNIFVEYTNNGKREYLLERIIEIFREYYDKNKQSLNYFSKLKPNGIYIWNMLDKNTVKTTSISNDETSNNCHGYATYNEVENIVNIKFHRINKYKEMYKDVYCLSTNELLGIDHEQ